MVEIQNKDSENVQNVSEELQLNLRFPDHTFSVISDRPKCPKCKDRTGKVWKVSPYKDDFGNTIKRWSCRCCGMRFSDRDDLTKTKACKEQFFAAYPKMINSADNYLKSNQICVLEAKNLDAEQQSIVLLKEQQNTTTNIESIIAKYEWYLKKEGRKQTTIVGRAKLLKLLWKRGANLNDVDSVKTVIANQNSWCDGRKSNAVDAYHSYLLMEGRTWTKPAYNKISKIPFVPKDTEIDQLISGCTDRIATFLQLLKETYARAGEMWHCADDNFDFEAKTVSIVPEKNSNPRIFPMSDKLVGMLQQLPRTYGKYYFATPEMKLDHFRTSFEKQRKRIAKRVNNPRINKIMFKTLRTWGGTMEYHRTKDPLKVMQLLGHKNLKNTYVYIQLDAVLFKDVDEYVTVIAKDAKEACAYIDEGYEFVCLGDLPKQRILRKRKY